jgi:hypothetical protein
MSDYDTSKPKSCPNCRKRKNVNRNYEEDSVTSNYIKGLHECETLGEYADKQTKKYGEAKCERMRRDFVTKKKPGTGMKELPKGMSRNPKAENLTSTINKRQAKRKRKNEK